MRTQLYSARAVLWALAVFALGSPLIIPCAEAQARTLRVRKDGTGDYTTIQACINAMAGGDTCLVGPGAYQERVKPSGKSGTASTFTTFKAETPGTVDIWGVDTANCNYLLIQGFNISIPASLTGWTDGVGVAVRSSNVQIVSNYIHDVHYAAVSGTGNGNVRVIGNHAFKCGMGIVISGDGWLVEGNDIERLLKYSEIGDADNTRFFGSNHTIRGNHFYGTSSSETGSAHVDGFQTFDDNGDFAQHIIIENNLLEGFYHQGVFMEATFHSNTYDITVRNNIFIGASTYAVGSVRNMRDVKAYNNTVINPAIFGIRYEQSSTGEARNNICYSSKTGIPDGDIKELTYSADATSTITGTSNLLYIPSKTIAQSSFPDDFVNLNPQFVNLAGNNFHLLANSPAIDRAGTLTGFSTDRDGVARPQGAAWDIGAYEYTAGVADTTPPVMSAVASSGITPGGATVTWTTDENSSSAVDYGTTTGYGSVVSNATLVTGHSLVLSGLSASTPFHYRVRSRDAVGNASTSGDFAFTTLAVDATAPTVNVMSPAATTVVSNIVTLSVAATDAGSGVASVTFLVDGVAVGIRSSPPYTNAWTSGTVANGPHTIAARAQDMAGNSATSAVITVTVQNPALLLTSGLIGYWPFDEAAGTTTRDLSVGGNDGALLNGTSWAAGKLRGALSLDGVDDYVRVPSTASLEQVTSAVSLCAWIKISSNSSMQSIARKVLSETANVAPYSAYDLVVLDSAGTFKARMGITRSSDNTRGVAVGGTHAYGAWYHLAGVYDGAAVRIYVNGVEEASAAFSGSVLQTSQPLCIGRYGSVTEAVKGNLDDFRLYNRALSAAEVQLLYNITVPLPPANLRIVEE